MSRGSRGRTILRRRSPSAVNGRCRAEVVIALFHPGLRPGLMESTFQVGDSAGEPERLIPSDQGNALGRVIRRDNSSLKGSFNCIHATAIERAIKRIRTIFPNAADIYRAAAFPDTTPALPAYSSALSV